MLIENANDHNCMTVDFKTGDGCPIGPNNSISGCIDRYRACKDPEDVPIGTCTETVTQNIYVGICLAETRTITFTFESTEDTCKCTVSRN